jgi:hypothetical protein
MAKKEKLEREDMHSVSWVDLRVWDQSAGPKPETPGERTVASFCFSELFACFFRPNQMARIEFFLPNCTITVPTPGRPSRKGSLFVARVTFLMNARNE